MFIHYLRQIAAAFIYLTLRYIGLIVTFPIKKDDFL